MMTSFLTWLQETSVALWVSGSPSLLGYPTILVLHTVGLAMLVGGNVAVDLRLLGVAKTAPWNAVVSLFRLMWAGLALNTVTGVLLFMADAVRKANQPIFLVKLAFIAAAIVVLLRIQALVRRAVASPVADEPHAGSLALLSLLLWAGALTAGRLVAYLPAAFFPE